MSLFPATNKERPYELLYTLNEGRGGGTLEINWLGICRWDFGLLVYPDLVRLNFATLS